MYVRLILGTFHGLEIDLQTESQWKPSLNFFEVIRAREVNPRDTLNFPKHAFRSIFNPFMVVLAS